MKELEAVNQANINENIEDLGMFTPEQVTSSEEEIIPYSAVSRQVVYT